MNYAECKENLVISTGLNIQVSDSTYLIDLLRLEYSQDVRIELAILYLTEILKTSQYSFSQELTDIGKNKIILLKDWSLLLCSDSLLYIFLESAQLHITRANLNRMPLFKSFKEGITSIKLVAESGYSYLILYICKLWITSVKEIESILDSKDFYSLKSSMRDELSAFIYSSANISPKVIQSAITQCKSLLSAESPEKSSKDLSIPNPLHTPTTKPLCEFLMIETRLSVESLEYTQSEETGKIDTSFRLSNTITGRFPRLSGSSIALAETPSKETKKSYGEYAECMESQRSSSINNSPNRVLGGTPIHSPKQSAYSIQQVKQFMIPGHKDYLEKESPAGKETIRRNRSPGVRAFSFRDKGLESKNNEACLNSGVNRYRTVFEEKKSSCQCQSCDIF